MQLATCKEHPLQASWLAWKLHVVAHLFWKLSLASWSFGNLLEVAHKLVPLLYCGTFY